MKKKNYYYGFNPPFIGGPQNVMSKQVDERLIKNDILQLLLTSRGERVMRPDFGTDIRSMVFEALDSTALDILRDNITDAITTYEPRVDIVSLNLYRDNQRNGLQISLVVKLKLDPTQVLTIDRLVKLQGEQ